MYNLRRTGDLHHRLCGILAAGKHTKPALDEIRQRLLDGPNFQDFVQNPNIGMLVTLRMTLMTTTTTILIP